MENGLSASDVALMNKDSGWGDNGFMWIFALLLLPMLGGYGGFGRNGNDFGYHPQYATQDFVQNGFNFNDLQSQNRDILSAIQQTSYDTSNFVNSALASITSTVKDTAYQNLTENRDIQAALSAGFAEQQKCCCETLRSLDGVNYNNAINTANINANTTAQTQKILDAIANNRMNDMQNQINALQLRDAMCGVVRYPTSTTYSVPSSCFGNTCGCNI